MGYDKKFPMSAFAINYNGSEYLKDCLSSLSFCEQLIYVDKSSDDNSVNVAKEFTDEIFIVEWSPIVEDTRQFALDKCKHEWVIFLDHDEMLDADLIKWIQKFVENRGDEYDAAAILRKDFYFGEWSSRQRTWPFRHIRMFKKTIGKFIPVIHTTVQLDSNRIYQHQESDGGAIIHHGYETLMQWVSKMNRYTSRTKWNDDTVCNGDDIFNMAESLLMNAKKNYSIKKGNSYEAVTHIIFLIYNLVKELKKWESVRDLNVKENYVLERKKISAEIQKFLNVN